MVGKPANVRNLVVVLGDQLSAASAAFDGFDPNQDVVLQMEVAEEATYIRQHKMRLAYFFSSMRHFREELIGRGFRTHYVEIDQPENTGSFTSEIVRLQRELKPDKMIMLEPGDWHVAAKLEKLPSLEVREDRSFFCSKSDFASFCIEHPKPHMPGLRSVNYLSLPSKRLCSSADESGERPVIFKFT